MLLYVNGDSHTAAAEAVNNHAFAEDDPRLYHLGRLPHPDNLQVSWGRRLADVLKATFKCDAESASSNARIIRTTKKWINDHYNPNTDTLMVIQWSTWEREEWLIDDVYYQVNASGIDIVPESAQQRYKEYIASINWNQRVQQAHSEIWEFHLYLQDLGIKHVFFNGNNHFESITDRKDWGVSYVDPYSKESTFHEYLQSKDIDTASPNTWHYGEDGHAMWNRFLITYLSKNKLV